MAFRLQAEMRTIVANNVSMQFSASSSRRYLEQVRFIAIIGFLWPQLQCPSSRVPHFKVFCHGDETPPCNMTLESFSSTSFVRAHSHRKFLEGVRHLTLPIPHHPTPQSVSQLSSGGVHADPAPRVATASVSSAYIHVYTYPYVYLYIPIILSSAGVGKVQIGKTVPLSAMQPALAHPLAVCSSDWMSYALQKGEELVVNHRL